MHVDKWGYANFSLEEILDGWECCWLCPYCRTDLERVPCKNCGAHEEAVPAFRKGKPIK